MDSISVIVTTHNNEATIRRTLESVDEAIDELHRGKPEYRAVGAEVVVVDDGSADRTLEEAGCHAQGRGHYRLIRRSRASSPSCARNTGVEHSAGELLFFLDGDDTFLPHHVLECYDVLRDPTIDFVKTGVGLSDPVHPDWKMRIENSIVINTCVRSRCHEHVGGFPDYHLFRRSGDLFQHDSDLSYKIEDMFYNYLLSQLCRGVRIVLDTVMYFRHPGNSFDRQYEKFRLPFGAYQEVPEPGFEFRFQVCNLIVQEQIAAIRRRQAEAAELPEPAVSSA